MPYLCLLALAPQLSIAIAYADWHSPYLQYSTALRIAAVTSALFYVGTVMTALLNGVERTRSTFVAQLMYAGTTVVVVLPLTAMFGLMGAFVGSLFAAAALAITCAYYVMTLSDEPIIAPVSSLHSHLSRKAA